MRVSVITICRNSAKTLARTLKSVGCQDYPDVEHILIDGGSTDSSASVIQAFQKQLAFFSSEPDEGIYDAMNKGLEVATGDIICFLNSDDYYPNSSVVSTVVKKMEAANVEALIGNVAFFREGHPNVTVREYRSDRFKPERLAWGWMPAHPALFLRSNITNRVGKFKTDYQISGDFDYVIRIFHNQFTSYVHVDNILVRMQIGGVSTRNFGSLVKLNLEVLRACRENKVDTNIFKILTKYPLKLLEFLKLRR